MPVQHAQLNEEQNGKSEDGRNHESKSGTDDELFLLGNREVCGCEDIIRSLDLAVPGHHSTEFVI